MVCPPHNRQASRYLLALTAESKPAGSALQVLLMLGLLGAGVARVRHKIITDVRSCKCCYGYGIER